MSRLHWWRRYVEPGAWRRRDGMTMVKKAVSLDADVVAAAEELAGGNFSAFVNDALARHVR